MKIEKGVPIPPASVEPPIKPDKWNILSEMEVGDSVFFDVYDPKVIRSAHAQANFRGVKVSCRREGNGFRIWRVK